MRRSPIEQHDPDDWVDRRVDEVFGDPAYRMMAEEVADNRLAFVKYLIERGDHEAAREESNRAKADLEELPTIWLYLEAKALRERDDYTVEDVEALFDEAEQRVAEWLGRSDS